MTNSIEVASSKNSIWSLRAHDRRALHETKELIAGYTLIQVKSREEALEWTKRFPDPAMKDGEIEVRQLFELEDFGPSEAIERFRKIGVGKKK